MKKVLLGLFALSAVAMAASNPGMGDTEAQANNKKAEVGVPMEVRVEILPAEKRLVMVDENNKLIDKLIFDHGRLVKGKAVSDSVIEKTVKVMVEDGTPFGQNVKVTFAAKQKGKLVKEVNNFELGGLGTVSSSSISSKLKYKEEAIKAESTATEVSTPVISTISAVELNKANSGLYIGQGTFEATVEKDTVL